MNGKNFSTYRQNNYRKRRIRFILTLSAVVVGLLIILFVIFGGALNKKTNDGNSSQQQTNQTNNNNQKPTIPSVNGQYISIDGLDSSSLASVVSSARGRGGNGISFSARDDDGNELYSSGVARHMGLQSSSGGYISVSEIKRRVGSSINLSAGVDLLSFSEKDDINRSVRLAYDAAVCAELLDDGADDVFVRLVGTQISSSNIDEILRLADAVKSINADAVIGIVLSSRIVEDAGMEAIIAQLWEKFDFFVYDMTSYKSGSDGYEFAEENISPTVHYHLLRYNARVLLPVVETDVLEAMVSALTDKGIDNWQTYSAN